MDLRPNARVRARGLIWDVLEVDRAADRDRISLRCVEGDMAGLEWELFVPPDQVDLVEVSFDPNDPAPLSLWHLLHRAHLLNQLPDVTTFAARAPGRVRVEPYQLVPLLRALDMARPRLLLADGVGLGKTIQACLIATELIARRRAHRILIVAPSGPLVWQWEQETRLRFGLKFTLLTGAAELWEVRRAHELGANPFDAVALCIAALDFARQDHVLDELERSAWDLVIIDEAHHCAGYGPAFSRDNTLRRRLAEVLARRSDALLLLTATPHDGHDAHFASLIALLDPSLVDPAGGFVGQAYRRHVIRRMKPHIRDPITGAPLFRRRHVIPVAVDVNGIEHESVRAFHRALAAFVVPRLRRRRGAEDGLAFISLLKRSVSTIAACLETLRVVVERLARHDDSDGLSAAARRERARALRAWRRRTARFGGLDAVDEASQCALEIESMTESLRAAPGAEPAQLIHLGILAEAHDPKLAAMILEVRLIRLRDQRANILIYTEYTDSQAAAARALRGAAGIVGDVLAIDGQDDDRTRAAAARQFSETDGLILLSTDSLAEGLNLQQRCSHLIHLDLPYNPNRLEQRNGRIDRYGQQREPEIRYLYIPGTFEESLLLHLISKYEKARASLDVMPDTLGMTAEPDDRTATLTGELSEHPGDLFVPGDKVIRTLDQETPEAVGALLREIDRAFDNFDLMAVSHGWHGVRGINAGLDQVRQADQRSTGPDANGDLAEFVEAVVAAETNTAAGGECMLRLPSDWTYGLDDLPGFDAGEGVFRIAPDVQAWHDTAGHDTGFLGRAHPLVLRAIRHGCRLPGTVAIADADELGLLLSFELEISVSNRPAFRQMIGVLVRPDRAAAEIGQWLTFGAPTRTTSPTSPWLRHFASWAAPARTRAARLVDRIASQKHAAFVDRFEAADQERIEQSRRWLRATAEQLCGPLVTPTGDLFGTPDSGPVWRTQEDPVARLIALATDLAVPAAKRRGANDALETYRAIQRSRGGSGPIRSRPVGMLMLVPNDAC